MLGWIALFLIVAIVAAIFGFGGIIEAATTIAIVLFWIFLALLVVSLLYQFVFRRH